MTPPDDTLQPGEIVHLPPRSLSEYEAGRVYAGLHGRLWRCVEIVNGVPDLRSITATEREETE